LKTMSNRSVVLTTHSMEEAEGKFVYFLILLS
jgi:hypothetical protein